MGITTLDEPSDSEESNAPQERFKTKFTDTSDGTIDPSRSRHRYVSGKEKTLEAFPDKESGLIRTYIHDMEQGRNVHGRKGKRGYIHLNTLLSRLVTISRL
ncbi:MAG: hypothetical protein Q7S65_03050, partial [Nanoarchaeota archaeon]|nr:hypothetical protein [Nanoarchaeota archaeon]